MSDLNPHNGAMRTLRFREFGEPAEVLRLEMAAIPKPGPDRVLVRVAGCGLNPADWALCRGLFPGNLPRGVGLDVSGVVEKVGEGVDDVDIGDRVFGPADYVGSQSAGAADYSILSHWAKMPAGLDVLEAAALTMAVETAFRSLAWLDVQPGQTILVNGGGTMVGFAAVQMALLRGAPVITTAGETFAARLRGLGASVTPYGEGMVERVRDIAGGSPDLIFDAAPVNLEIEASADRILSDLIAITGGDARRILTVNFLGACKFGVRTGMGEAPTGPGGQLLRYDVLGEFGRLAADGRFSIPIARTFSLEEWPEALDISLKGRAHGKLMLVPSALD